eukprot:CAMPEP_0114602518 /NCGR_PEP_ID=MMETSP0125-20121206/25089_1 /TAXON_ID=485358 ORGANISM="Aristerostoma sp., Strain ATCC 50986" /NCGR_SAMPLE_ID=MMETSP0125 /ASSEMBLY_ACC=CAM_ASM_000245 /LENGTH=87 /DNA_ID=CAMNT_0001812731 /DNA_START=372 /DNA_END=638 /DNA_ORIENTATION=+
MMLPFQHSGMSMGASKIVPIKSDPKAATKQPKLEKDVNTSPNKKQDPFHNSMDMSEVRFRGFSPSPRKDHSGLLSKSNSRLELIGMN